MVRNGKGKYVVTNQPGIINVSRVFQHGKTQIPSDVRKILEISDGDRIVWYSDGDRIFVKKA